MFGPVSAMSTSCIRGQLDIHVRHDHVVGLVLHRSTARQHVVARRMATTLGSKTRFMTRRVPWTSGLLMREQEFPGFRRAHAGACGHRRQDTPRPAPPAETGEMMIRHTRLLGSKMCRLCSRLYCPPSQGVDEDFESASPTSVSRSNGLATTSPECKVRRSYLLTCVCGSKLSL